MKERKPVHPVIDNIRKIIVAKGITQETAAELAGTSASQFSKILNGTVQISIWQISNLATNLDMRIIDVFTYPDIYRQESGEEGQIEAMLQIKLKNSMKDKVLRIVFGDNNMEIINN
jgi:transcriptional regulator with XRE-family HTH domain